MSEPTEAEYVAAIPKCCGIQSIEGHMAMMLCWSLVQRLRDGEAVTEGMCSGCDIRKPAGPPETDFRAIAPQGGER